MRKCSTGFHVPHLRIFAFLHYELRRLIARPLGPPAGTTSIGRLRALRAEGVTVLPHSTHLMQWRGNHSRTIARHQFGVLRQLLMDLRHTLG
jgi:hypothetical protein